MGSPARLILALNDPALKTPHYGMPSFNRIHEPRPGRLSSIEDPAELEYPRWSPFDSPEGRARQWAIARTSAAAFVFNCWLADLCGVGLAALVLVPVLALWRRDPAGWREVFLAAPPLGVLLGYLPFYYNVWRYQWPVTSVTLAAAMVLVERVDPGESREGPKPLLSALVLVLALGGALAAAAVGLWKGSGIGQVQAADARRLAAALAREAPDGPIASWGPGPSEPTTATGIYVGWVARRRWIGYAKDPADLAAAEALGCRALVVEGVPDAPAWLASAPGWREAQAFEAGDQWGGLGRVVYRLYVRTPPREAGS